MNPAAEITDLVLKTTTTDLDAADSLQWIEVLNKFRDTLEIPTKPFMQLPFDKRKALVDAVVNRLKNSKNDEEIKVLATIVRILARESGNELASICNQNFITFCWNFAGYDKEDNAEFSLSARSEVGKCLVNIFFKMPESLDLALKEGKHFQLLEKVGNWNPLTQFTPEYSFPVLRLLFLFARPQDGLTIYRDFALKGAITLMFSLMRAWMTIENCSENQAVLLALKEALQVVFSCTLDMGNLAKGEQMNYEAYIPGAKDEMRTVVDLICMNSNNFKDHMFELKMSTMNCCVNIPMTLVSVLLQVGDKDAVLKNLFDLLDYEMTLVEADETRKSFLPLFIVLKNLFALNPDIRAYGMQRLFPDRNLAEEKERSTDGKLCMDLPPSVLQSTGNKFVKLMTSFHQAVQFTSNDLIFALVGEDPDAFIRLVGFGNAAGLLAMRNLFGMGANLKGPDTLSQFREAAKERQGPKVEDMTEEEKEAFLRSIHATDEAPPTATPNNTAVPTPIVRTEGGGPPLANLPELIPEVEGETEEDKEDRMVRNFEKLVDAGFIKLIKKEDGSS